MLMHDVPTLFIPNTVRRAQKICNMKKRQLKRAAELSANTNGRFGVQTKWEFIMCSRKDFTFRKNGSEERYQKRYSLNRATLKLAKVSIVGSIPSTVSLQLATN